MNFFLILLRFFMGFPPGPPRGLQPVPVRRDGRRAGALASDPSWDGSEFALGDLLWSWLGMAMFFPRRGDIARGRSPGGGRGSFWRGRQRDTRGVVRRRPD